MNTIVCRHTVRGIMSSPVYLTAFALATLSVFLNGGDPARFVESGAYALLLAIVTVVFGSRLIGPEKSSGMLQIILATAAGRREYLVARFVGTVFSLLALESVVLIIAALMQVGMNRDVPWGRLAASLANFGGSSAFIVSLLCLFGVFTVQYYNLGCLFLSLVFLMQGIGAIVLGANTLGFDLYPFLIDSVFVQSLIRAAFFDLAPEAFSTKHVALNVATAAIVVFLAAVSFSRRDLPSPSRG